jgi:hypothetical protein
MRSKKQTKEKAHELIRSMFDEIEKAMSEPREGWQNDQSPFHEEDDGYPPPCTNPEGHKWVYSGTAYGGDDESYHGEGRCYCEHCGADGDA